MSPLLKLVSCLFAFALGILNISAATYPVASLAELTTRVSAAEAGDTIIVKNGTYTVGAAIEITRAGAASKPIVIRAETVGGVEITGTRGFSLESPATYITIQGFKFTHATSIRIAAGTSHCRLARNIIELKIP